MNRLKNAVILVLVFTMLFPAIAGAAPQADVRIPPRLPIPANGSPALQITWVEDQQGIPHRIAHRTVPDGAGQRLDFWLIENDAQLAALQSYLTAEAIPGSPVPQGFNRLPDGGWIWWNSGLIRFFFSHSLVLKIKMGCNVFSAIFALAAIVLPEPHARAITGAIAILSQLGKDSIEFLDEDGDPGFSLYVRVKPLLCWFTP